MGTEARRESSGSAAPGASSSPYPTGTRLPPSVAERGRLFELSAATSGRAGLRRPRCCAGMASLEVDAGPPPTTTSTAATEFDGTPPAFPALLDARLHAHLNGSSESVDDLLLPLPHSRHSFSTPQSLSLANSALASPAPLSPAEATYSQLCESPQVLSPPPRAAAAWPWARCRSPTRLASGAPDFLAAFVQPSWSVRGLDAWTLDASADAPT